MTNTVLVRRGTSNSNVRGNSYDRARRRAWALTTFGDGVTCPCYRCGVTLDNSTITMDRIKPGVQGGRYTRDNLRPACGDCNSETGGMLATETGRVRLAQEQCELVGV